MKLLTANNEQLIDVDIQVDSKNGLCDPTMIVRDQIKVEGPQVQINLQKAPTGNGLLVQVGLPDLISFHIMIEKEDIKKLKGLMNKDALGFMVKALM